MVSGTVVRRLCPLDISPFEFERTFSVLWGSCSSECEFFYANAVKTLATLFKVMKLCAIMGVGTGSYHGEYGYQMFSHKRGVLQKYGDDVELRFPPCTDSKLWWLNTLRNLPATLG